MKNVFLSQFLMISEWKTILFLIAYLLLAFAVCKLPFMSSFIWMNVIMSASL